MRNAITSLALWSSLVLQAPDRGLAASGNPLFTGIAAAAMTRAAIAGPGAGLASVPATPVWGMVASGEWQDAAANSGTTTGNPGPGGGTIIDRRNSNLDYDLEVRPYYNPQDDASLPVTMTYDQAAVLQPGFPGSGWRLPEYSELFQIYRLYLLHEMIRLDQFSPLSHGSGNFIWTSTEHTVYDAVSLHLNRLVHSTDIDVFATNFGATSKDLNGGVCFVRVHY
jgi:hypothetical protein